MAQDKQLMPPAVLSVTILFPVLNEQRCGNLPMFERNA